MNEAESGNSAVARADAETWDAVAALAKGDVSVTDAVVEILELADDLGDGPLVVGALLGHTSQLLSRLAEVLGESVPQTIQRYAEYYQFIDVIRHLEPGDDDDA